MTFADLLYKGVVKVGKIMLKRKYGKLPTVSGRENIPEPPYIVVANYLELFEGPMAAINTIPIRLYPWTANIWMDRHKAVRQAKRTFRPSIGNDILLNIAATAWGIGYSWLHNYGESIPIFRSKDYKKGDPRLRDTLNETFELSVDALLDGKSLLIMPEERAGEPDKNHLWKFQPGAANVAKHYFEREGDLPKLKYVLVGVSFKTGDVSIDNVVLEDFSGDNKSISELKSLLENTIQDMCTEMNYTGIENITYGANLDESFEDKQQKYWDLQSLVIYDLGAEHVESLMAPHELHSIYNVPNKGLTFHIDLKDHVGIRIESEGPMVEDLYDDIIEILIPNYVPPPPQSFFSLL